jgi:hypothetical protein
VDNTDGGPRGLFIATDEHDEQKMDVKRRCVETDGGGSALDVSVFVRLKGKLGPLTFVDVVDVVCGLGRCR